MKRRTQPSVRSRTLAFLPVSVLPAVYVYVCVSWMSCCTLQPEEEWQADLEHLESLIDSRTKLIVVTNPSNPCGSVYPQHHIRAITDIAARHHLPVIADEIYMGLQYGEEKFHAVHLANREVPVILCGGIGKRYMIPGWRLGWLVVFDRHNYLKSSVSHAALPHYLQHWCASHHTHTSPCTPSPPCTAGCG